MVRGLISKAPRGVIAVPWAGAVLLSWAGLVGQRKLVARGPWCRETAVPRSSSSAQCSRAGGSDRRDRVLKGRQRVAGCTELTGGEHFPALNLVSLWLEGNAVAGPGGRRYRGCRQGCPGLWCRAGSLLCPRGCVPGQGLCILPGSALSLTEEPRRLGRGRAGQELPAKRRHFLHSACLFLLWLWGRLCVNRVV